MCQIVATTGPNSEGEMLWCVHFKSSRYDSDERMPGTVSVDSRTYVLARTRDEAISKAEPRIVEARKLSDEGAEEEIEATIVVLENLMPARDSRGEGRLGWISSDKLRAVRLSCEEDTSRYRLGVCLVPVE